MKRLLTRFSMRSRIPPALAHPFSRFSIRVKILSALAVDLCLMMALGAFAMFQMGLMFEQAEEIKDQTIPQLETVATMESVLNKYRKTQLELVVYENQEDKDRLIGAMEALEGEMDNHIAAYRARQPGPAAELADFEQGWEAFVNRNTQPVSGFVAVYSQANSGNAHPVFNRSAFEFEELVGMLEDLADASRADATTAFDQVQAAYDTARHFIFADTIFTLFISAVIGLVLSGRIAGRITNLRRATQKVARGDLERKVEISSKDEIGSLAANFNLMVDSLREQRYALQQRNAALQASLERQQQLTDDLIKRKASEEAAVRAQASAEAASEAKSMFLATMSHELRTPLTAILGYAQIMQMTAGTDVANDNNEYLDRILAAGRHLTTMINNVLDFSKIEQGKMDLDLTDFSVAALVDDVVSVIVPLLEKNGNHLDVHYPDDIGSMHGDQGKVRQILFNLLSNAAKFTHKGQIGLHVASMQRDDQEWIRFTVSDTGIGIAATDLAHLFQPFRQVDNSATRKYDGTGLGLALSHNMCELMGGAIEVESEINVGSRFIVYLPVRCQAHRTEHRAFQTSNSEPGLAQAVLN
jgi:signal transduction histidine kinase